LARGQLLVGTSLNYAFGVTVATSRGLDLVEHAGSTGGYRAVLTRFPTHKTTVAVLCNVSNAEPAALAHRVADHLLGAAFTAPAPAPSPSAVAAAAAARAGAATPVQSVEAMGLLAGQYYSEELNANYEITVNGSSLTLKRPRAVPETLTLIDAAFLRSSVGTLRFTVGSGGRATSFVLTGSRVQDIVFRRR
ncbi:MAG: hypothetical protein Q8L75_11345, partial [Acidobacteriota bacterium]|nr:hypothetical protein [Acidobacteriota bacterium]